MYQGHSSRAPLSASMSFLRLCKGRCLLSVTRRYRRACQCFFNSSEQLIRMVRLREPSIRALSNCIGPDPPEFPRHHHHR